MASQGDELNGAPVRIREDGDDFVSQLKKSSHFHIVLLDFILKGLSILLFLFCTVLLGSSFIIHFVVITTLLAGDFWFVKNVTGRKLVGMRWWSEPSSDGAKSTWQFENMVCESAPTRRVSKVDSTYFWSGLFVMTGVWLAMAIMFFMSPGYCILAILGFSFSGGNLWGYWKCSRWGKAEAASMRSGGFGASIQDVTSTIATGFLNVINKV